MTKLKLAKRVLKATFYIFLNGNRYIRFYNGVIFCNGATKECVI